MHTVAKYGLYMYMYRLELRRLHTVYFTTDFLQFKPTCLRFISQLTWKHTKLSILDKVFSCLFPRGIILTEPKHDFKYTVLSLFETYPVTRHLACEEPTDEHRYSITYFTLSGLKSFSLTMRQFVNDNLSDGHLATFICTIVGLVCEQYLKTTESIHVQSSRHLL